MTLLHIFSGDAWAGAERMILALLRQLVLDRSLRVIALSLNEGALTRALREVGIEVHTIDEAVFGFVRIQAQAKAMFCGQGIQLIHSHGYKANLLAWRLSRSLGVRQLVSTVHSLPEAAFHSTWRARFAMNIKIVLDRYILRNKFSRVVAVSADIRNTLVSQRLFCEDQMDLIYNGIEYGGFLPTEAKPRSTDLVHIGTVGRMVPVKNYALFLRVAAEVCKRAPQVRFSILGDGPMKGDLKNLAVELGVDQRVRFEGVLFDPMPYYESVDIYINTSIHEGLPISLLEAMSCGKPIVAPKVGGIPEVVIDGEQGLLVAQGEIKGYVDACVRLVHDQTFREKLGAQGIVRIHKLFSSTMMASSYRKLYECVVT